MPREVADEDLASDLPGSKGKERRCEEQVEHQEDRRRDHRDDEVDDEARAAAGRKTVANQRPRRPPASTSPAWLASVPYHGIRPRSSRTSVVPIAATQPPTAGPPKEHRAEDRGDRDRLLCPARQLNRERRPEQRQERSRTRRRAGLESRLGAPASDGPITSAICGSAGNTKSRSHERNRAQGHDSSDVELEGLRHRLPRTQAPLPRTLSPAGSVGVMEPNVLEAPQRRSTCECDHRNARERHDDAHELGLHRRCPYQPLAILGSHARSSFAALVSLRNTKTDQTHGRSVALLAPLHPKCPFQVVLRRVRAS